MLPLCRYGPGHYKSGLLGGLPHSPTPLTYIPLLPGKKTSASEDRCLYVQADSSAPDDDICLEFNTSGDCQKWFDVFTALLLASSNCPHYLQTL